ncbi:hypothetical protein F2Q68_00015431 [Brassica cretica]|uniref:Uncharacterized protein n=1 Tax=Brassica cretica TaxID=69181 RepID=A0A8S9HT18_BRACR|nr:hypothetical protein F2Q68_00015431 [Brassica cretica]
MSSNISCMQQLGIHRCMLSGTRSNKEKDLLFSDDPARLERTIRRGQRSTSLDATTSSSIDTHNQPSTDTRPSSSVDPNRSTMIDTTPRTSIDIVSSKMVNIIILTQDKNGNLYDQAGHLRNATGQKIDAQGTVIHDADATGAAQPVHAQRYKKQQGERLAVLRRSCSFERTIRRGQRSTSLDATTSSSIDTHNQPSTDTRLSSSIDPNFSTTIDTTPRTSIDTVLSIMVNIIILTQDENGNLYDQAGHLRDATGQKIDAQGTDERLETHNFTNTFPTSFDAVHSTSVDTHPRLAKQPLTSIDTCKSTSIDIRAAVKIQEQENIPSPTRDPDGNARATDGRILQVSREKIADILQVANGPDNLFSQQRATPDIIQTDPNNHTGVTTTEINPDLSRLPKGQASIDGLARTRRSMSSTDNRSMCMLSGTRSNKEKDLLFSDDPAHLERTIRRGQRSTSLDATTSSTIDTHNQPSNDTRPSSSIDPSRPTTIDTTPCTSIDNVSSKMVNIIILTQDENENLCMPSGTESNKEKYLLFSDDPAHLERTIRRGRRSTSLDATTLSSIDTHNQPSTDTRPPSSIDPSRSTTIDTTPRTSIDNVSSKMVNIIILTQDENEDLYDQAGHRRNATGQKIDAQGATIDRHSLVSASNRCMPSGTRSNKEKDLLFSDDPAHLERTIGRGQHSTSLDATTSSSIDTHNQPSTDTRPSSSIDPNRSTTIDTTPCTSIDTGSSKMVNIIILTQDENGNLYDHAGHLRNATGQKIDAQGTVIPDADATGAAQPVDEDALSKPLADYNRQDEYYSNRSAIRLPEIQKPNFELKPQYYTLVSQIPYSGTVRGSNRCYSERRSPRRLPAVQVLQIHAEWRSDALA